MQGKFIGAAARSALLVGFLATAAGPALAATVEWRVGPLALASGQILQLSFINLETSACRVGVAISATPAEVPRTGAVDVTPAIVANNIGNPRNVPAGDGLIAGYEDPNLRPGERQLLQGRVVCDCARLTAAVVRRLPVTMEIVDRATGEVRAALPGVAQ
jgi:hypothetical protein